jgi:chromatin remodeling complex protein RSC6
MVKNTKAVKTPVENKTPEVPAVVAAAPVEAAAPTKKASKKAAKTEVAAPVVAAPEPVVEVAAPVTETVAPTDVADASSSDAKITEIEELVNQLNSVLSKVKSELKVLRKTSVREKKVALKNHKVSKKASGNRKPSGFIKPARISDELARFLGVAAGTEMSRTNVAKELNAYINTHNLKNAKNGRIINADEKLSTLLKLPKGEELSYFNLQTYLKHHFIKTAPVATA